MCELSSVLHEPSLGPTSSLSGVFSSHSDLEILLSTWALRLSPKDTSPSPVLVPHCPDLPRTAAWVSVRTKLILSSGHLLRQTLLQWHTQQPSAEAAMWTPCHAAGAPGCAGLASLTMHSSFEEPTSAHCEHRVVPCPHQYFFNLCLQFPKGSFIVVRVFGREPRDLHRLDRNLPLPLTRVPRKAL